MYVECAILHCCDRWDKWDKLNLSQKQKDQRDIEKGIKKANDHDDGFAPDLQFFLLSKAN